MDVVLERIRRHGDLFEGVLTTRQRLEPALRRSAKVGGLRMPMEVECGWQRTCSTLRAATTRRLTSTQTTINERPHA